MRLEKLIPEMLLDPWKNWYQDGSPIESYGEGNVREIVLHILDRISAIVGGMSYFCNKDEEEKVLSGWVLMLKFSSLRQLFGVLGTILQGKAYIGTSAILAPKTAIEFRMLISNYSDNLIAPSFEETKHYLLEGPECFRVVSDSVAKDNLRKIRNILKAFLRRHKYGIGDVYIERLSDTEVNRLYDELRRQEVSLCYFHKKMFYNDLGCSWCKDRGY